MYDQIETRSFDDADAAVARITEIYEASVGRLRDAFERVAGGSSPGPVAAFYPFAGFSVGHANLNTDARHAYGILLEAGDYRATLTRPDLFAAYYREQIALVMRRHRIPVQVGLSHRAIPLPYIVEQSVIDVGEREIRMLQEHFSLPDLRSTDDSIANGNIPLHSTRAKPLALFSAERVDFSLARLKHYTGTAPGHFQGFILLTNYQRYVEAFVDFARAQVGRDGYTDFVEPGDRVHSAGGPATGRAPRHLPQMPAYHLKRAGGDGITLVNIGVGPSNAKTITDHLAVLRPHCWLVLGHCAGLRRSQLLGDYVLAHGYVRADHVLDHDVPQWIPVPAIAEVQQALQEATALVTGLEGLEMKTRMRTGTVFTTDNRNWELRFDELFAELNQSRAIAVDMESATVAANGFRFRVPYGTLLCVSDKPLHGELKLAGMANAFYRERVRQHLRIGLETMRILRERGVDRLHSRKLRGFDEPAFR